MEIVGFPNYVIYPDGRVYSKKSNIFMTGTDNGKGYLQTAFSGKRKYIHRLVAEHYIPNPENKATVDHIDRDKNNNRVDNLRWATMKEQKQNQKLYKIRTDNKSGHKNIRWHKKDHKWVYQKKYKNKSHSKSFDTKIDALCYKFYFLLSHRKYFFG